MISASLRCVTGSERKALEATMANGRVVFVT